MITMMNRTMSATREPDEDLLVVRTDGGPDVRRMTTEQALRLRVLLSQSLVEVAPFPTGGQTQIRWQELSFARAAMLISERGGQGLNKVVPTVRIMPTTRSIDVGTGFRIAAIVGAITALFLTFSSFYLPPDSGAVKGGNPAPAVTMEDHKIHVVNDTENVWVRPVIAVKSGAEWYEFRVPSRIQPEAQLSIALPVFRSQQRSFPLGKTPTAVRLKTSEEAPVEITLPSPRNSFRGPIVGESIASDQTAGAPASANPSPQINTKSFFANTALITE